MEADIPSGETKRELETDENVVTKAEGVEAALIPIVEANKELGIDEECALRAEVDEAANREMETGEEQTTVAREDEHDSMPTAEPKREIGTIEEATDRESAIEAVFDQAAHRETETDAEEVTLAKENEPDLIPTAEANRDIETVDVATVDEDKDDALISITEASREMEPDEVEATRAEEEEAASIPMVEVRRQLEIDRKHTMEAEDGENASVPNGEADIKLETDGDYGKCAEDRDTAKYIPKAEDGEGSSVPTEEGNRELERDGEVVMEVKDCETATYITKAEDSDDASVPTGEANQELETDRDDVMEVEDRETPSVQTVEGNREFIEDAEDIMRSEDAEDIMRSEDGEAASMLEDSQEDPQYGENEASTAEETATEIETETDVVDSAKGFSGKHKKRKNSNSPSTPKATTRAPRRKVTGEDVCFICFDGGDLVLCDRRGCPKAYHPSCVNRDEAFFRAKGRWNCGWHQCSICEKNPHYMCYTCPYSLCKGCVKGAVFLCIRRNKGFCETCMRVVRLIESKQQGGEDIHVDFDDKSSWEFLFKDYYMDLKEKLSLSSEEIANAKSAWKGSDVSGNRHEQSAPHFDSNEDGGSGSDNSDEKVEVNSLKRRKVTKRSKSLSKEAAMSNIPVIAGNEGTSTPDSTAWASKELIEFVKHMRNGDTSVVPQFEVQTLLLEYIQRNKLRTPNKKSQITCDSRLQSLFGKPRVMHFEMLKLLESHFHIKEDSHTDDAHGTVVDTEIEADENQDTPVREVKDRKHKRKKGNIRGPQSNLDDYAAIDMHNIGLIYGRRKLMEDLLEDVENFQDKIVGTFVRIRISGNNQKQDMYRLVQVIGLSKTSDPYKVGKRTTDILLEILNLNKTEVISIDTISNQDFTEDECKRLRQSMKCGLINRPKVGVILDKALELHEARVNDWLESEILRITNLRDRASEKGRRKEYPF
ncbi:unnamed protein product [Cuscuta campestris]|uniref:PHD-type domain-containing protein n=1 Tax=Cuscuta campestris TaxID=132261 RepID=A0A484KTB7_9ASTE|nr:unnamed protein product [Cuscuta campestris]